MENAQRDGKSFAVLLKNLKGGIHTYQATFDALQAKYEPFLNKDFEQAFFQGVRNDK